MGKQVSRRMFLARSAIALGAVAVWGLGSIGGAEQMGVSATPVSFAGADTTNQTSSRGIPDRKGSAMKIILDVEGRPITATLVDNATSRDFVSLLPLELTLKDYAATEKVSDLPRRLSTEGAPAGSDPAIGDITYYSPWGNLAIFYRDFGYAAGLIKIGSIDSDLEALNRAGPIRVTIRVLGR